MKCFCKLLSSTNTLFGQVKDLFFVIKFQSRGNEHNHGLLWIKDAPKYGIDSNDKIKSFIDIYITCDKCLLLEFFCENQLHHHKQTCHKRKQLVCRFHFPLPPLHNSQILISLLNQNKNLQLKA
jgi:hypothetical protein